MKKLWFILSLVVFLFGFGFVGCEKTPGNEGNPEDEKKRISVWESVPDYDPLPPPVQPHLNVTITLTIDSTTNLINVSQFPDIREDTWSWCDWRFSHRHQFTLRNDSLFLGEGLEAWGTMKNISENEIEIENYDMYDQYRCWFLFRRKTEVE